MQRFPRIPLIATTVFACLMFCLNIAAFTGVTSASSLPELTLKPSTVHINPTTGCVTFSVVLEDFAPHELVEVALEDSPTFRLVGPTNAKGDFTSSPLTFCGTAAEPLKPGGHTVLAFGLSDHDSDVAELTIRR